jgi:cation diffusion facilitator CzcD-associated flavoprotein CzcO
MRDGRLAVLCCVWAATGLAGAADPWGEIKYCIIGAGPGGLQLGHYLRGAGRDYRIFERSGRAGSFFDAQPRHGRLISLNKRRTGRDSPEFNMRHDWNSLLDAPPGVAPVTNRTQDRWPRREVLAGYLRDFAAPQEAAGFISYGVEVESILRDWARTPPNWKGPGKAPGGLVLGLRRAGENSRARCHVVVVAAGLATPNRPEGMVGLELTTQYAELPEDGAGFEGQKVAVFGLGNAAFETADALAPHVDYVHVFPGRGRARLPLVSWETRYPGSLRAINAGPLDAYLLKSLDGGFQAAMHMP